MNVTAAAWIIVAVTLLILSLRRAVWAVALYLMTFFAAPQLWWWGRDLPSARYALWAGVVLLATVLFQTAQARKDRERRRFTLGHIAAVGMLLNATFVHFVLASRQDISFDTYVELVKYVLLFYLIWRAIETKRDFRIALMAMALGAAYIGWEVTINDRGVFSGSRLEGVGAPAAYTSNGLASLMLTVLPLAGSLFIDGAKKEKLIVLLAAPLTLNVLLLCNSRGAFLGLIAAGTTFLLLARGPTRKKAVKVLGLGAIALYMLLGDPKIMDRFVTTFAGSQERDNSAASRLEYWQAGLAMLADFPLGAGGGAFKFVYGGRYIEEVTGNQEERSIHNGYLTEATDWGVQGLGLKLMFVVAAFAAAYRTSIRCRREGRADDALVGICVMVSTTGMLVTCLFGSFLNNEWFFWLVGLLVAYSDLYEASAGLPVIQEARAVTSAAGRHAPPAALASRPVASLR